MQKGGRQCHLGSSHPHCLAGRFSITFDDMNQCRRQCQLFGCKLSQLESNKQFPKQKLTLIASQDEPVKLLGQDALGCHLQLSSAWGAVCMVQTATGLLCMLHRFLHQGYDVASNRLLKASLPFSVHVCQPAFSCAMLRFRGFLLSQGLPITRSQVANNCCTVTGQVAQPPAKLSLAVHLVSSCPTVSTGPNAFCIPPALYNHSGTSPATMPFPSSAAFATCVPDFCGAHL